MLVLLAAPWLISASALPHDLHAPVLALAWLWGGLGCWRGLRRPPQVMWLPSPPAPLQLDGQELQTVWLQVRGPWLRLRWQSEEGHGALLFWPDTLQRGQRRELRLAVAARAVPQKGRSMAP